MSHVLVLGGSGETAALVAALAAEEGVTGIVSLFRAGEQTHAWPVRPGGWADDATFSAWLEAERITAIVDATHPFASGMSARARRVAGSSGVPLLTLTRPEWHPAPEDRWTVIAEEADAADHIPRGARVFVATGRRSLPALAKLDMLDLVIRLRAPSVETCPFAHGIFRFDAPPYTIATEEALFRRLGINWLLTRNTGGDGSWPKIAAARRLGLPVAMIRRPPAPRPSVKTVEQAVLWLRHL